MVDDVRRAFAAEEEDYAIDGVDPEAGVSSKAGSSLPHLRTKLSHRLRSLQPHFEQVGGLGQEFD
jgi:hypothetical protein